MIRFAGLMLLLADGPGALRAAVYPVLHAVLRTGDRQRLSGNCTLALR